MKVNIILPNQHYQPGQIIKGQCDWDMESRKRPKYIRILLKVWNEGTHPQTIVVAETINLKPETSKGIVDFEFKLPLYPFSYQGKNFNICWGIQGELGNDVFHCQTFNLSSAVS